MKKFIIDFLLMLCGSLLFALSFPNFIADWGFAPLGWISLIPIVLLIRRIPFWATPLWGALYGYITYSIFNFWLATFNPISFILVPSIYAGWFFLFFPLLALADRAFVRYGWLAQWLVWVAYEIVRTKGFLGYSYGILGYSQYAWRSLIAIADIFGVMGVSILVSFPSFLIGGWLLNAGFMAPGSDLGASIPKLTALKNPERRWIVSGTTFLVCMLAANVYGIISKVDYADAPRWRPALIQPGINTWLSGIQAWTDAVDALIEQSQKALTENPDALIWPETSFVPSIEWHLKYRQEHNKVALIRRLQEFYSQVDIPGIIGNNDGVKIAGERKDYNAVLLLDKDKIVNRYRKIHLVPFSEHFPYGRYFPWLMKYIESKDTPLYIKGDQYTVFDLSKWGGPKTGQVICFEDTFGYLSRNFVREGAQVIVNLTNDSWSPQPACAIQHMTISIFRAVENRRSLVRSTTSGLTAAIDPNGKILQKLEPFTKDYLVADVPVYTDRQTIYNRFGSWFEKILLVIAGTAMLTAFIVIFYARRKKS